MVQGKIIMAKRSWNQTPAEETHSFESKHGTKIITWHSCMCCNPSNGRGGGVTFSYRRATILGKNNFFNYYFLNFYPFNLYAGF
jgi:hypothetical protein